MAQELVTRHHQAQQLVARNVIAELHPLWNILDFHDLKGTSPAWLKAVRPVVEKGVLTSQHVAAEFVKNYRASVLPAATPLNIAVPNPNGPFADASIPDRETQLKIMASMQVTGPIWVAKQSFSGMSDQDQADVIQRGFSKSAGAATRLVLNGGRGMVRLLADADHAAVGIVAVADDDGCEWCHARTVPALKSGGAKRMDAVAVGHDFCRCSAHLIY